MSETNIFPFDQLKSRNLAFLSLKETMLKQSVVKDNISDVCITLQRHPSIDQYINSVSKPAQILSSLTENQNNAPNFNFTKLDSAFSLLLLAAKSKKTSSSFPYESQKRSLNFFTTKFKSTKTPVEMTTLKINSQPECMRYYY